jgi:NUMOD3 motif
MNMEAFVYCWTDHKTNMLYVGSHKGTLDDGYVCSSKHMMKEYKKRPADFTRQIIAEGKLENIRILEGKILKASNARLDEQFYNKHDNDGLFFEGWKKGQFSEEHRRNMSIAASKRKRSPEHIAALHEGRRHSKNTEEHNAIIRAKAKPFQKGNIPWNTGKQHSEETRRKISETKRKKKEGLVDGD